MNRRTSHLVELGPRIAAWTLAAVLALAAAVALSALWPVVLHGVEARAETASASADYDWSFDIPAGKSIEIRGINGGIDVEYTTGTQTRVRAVKIAHRSNPDEVTVEFSKHEGGVTVCAIYGRNGQDCTPTSSLAESHKRKDGYNRNNTEVKFTIQVPAGVEFIGNTVNGAIHAQGLKSPVQARTVNGSVTVSTTHEAQVSTVNGSIQADMGKEKSSGDLEFSTVNGSITLRMPESFDAQLSASTVNGQIETDFPVTVKGRFGRKSLKGTIGNGRDLNLSTVNGSIRLRSLDGREL